MNGTASFDLFMRSAFGIEPGGAIGSRLESLAKAAALTKGTTAALDRGRGRVVFIARGATKLAAHATPDREQIVAFHFGGDIVTIPADGLYSYVLSALVDSEVLLFPAREFFDQAAADPAMARSMLDRLPAALHRCRDKTVALGQKTALERLAGFLIAMCERVGKSVQGCCVLELPMSRRDIADSLGLTIETVSRQISVLRELGLIETRGRSEITIFDSMALARKAGHCDPAEKFSTAA